jgi:hypothetical protein
MNVIARQKTLSDREVANRTTTGMNAIASTEMENLPVSAELREDIQGWSEGKLTLQTLVARTKARYAGA